MNPDPNGRICSSPARHLISSDRFPVSSSEKVRALDANLQPATSNLQQRSQSPGRPCSHLRARAFTLVEVMIACGIFFMASFSILALVANCLHNARVLQQHTEVDIGMAAALVSTSLKTNKLSDVALSGDFGEAYPDYSWEAEVNEYQTNGLLEVDIILNKRGSSKPVDFTSILVYAPDAQKSQPGAPNLR